MGTKNEQPADQAQQGLRTYRGNCHCGSFVYEVGLPEIKSAMECNCSICKKKGYLWVFPGEGSNFKIVNGTSETLAQYTFGPKKLAHRFCSTCATPVMGEFIGGDGKAFNVRAIQGVDAWALEKQPYDGAALGDKYTIPEHKGPLPPNIDGHKQYTGSCHCGSVTVALVNKPIDETCDDFMAECNCSICARNGYRWIYPNKERVVLFAADPKNIGRYSFARHVLNKTFCKICGVCMTNEYNYSTDEERHALGAIPDDGFANRMKTEHPVNLRLFPDVDLSKLKPPALGDAANKVPPFYKNP
ncbi:glutathione-dependent formaldehyde-activating gfa [Colletotrichum truncatum]|uniref:Glutathione-dependent formaldehyde-activating gfa n=1 Tax=Colletotrichum truncatum TaxID=5467 RepID=A0ACC3YRA8_COLTU|nr:glutathione-dependent formaldehyde-activating gfa [Colletotrichum truncatum]KAF6799096.1 glutathione-dependent formaldehyde-activating gfa [Colletotrichum truncatum]